ncbi:Peptidoglycan/LPS O-acetylase OafA/YrhL, contains acyltransferase and SGNH-hydrolase domains [Dyadobacter koreensis]|uniref:Peptidoglycan/LPS O-acetylase OafA/YrhL, contains acyltransferase and SGNH-hydrolase domains n=1 Tax=Dyadobacter koreensis TaxID=408657 RepID=A0A1H6S620_9BACT|nr:acyltransferase [Dyadobacter koreensis]SEI59440.1 Peptidoglycan/LPS O-acetylase OafA/YrhL, contains acyltransferase and SGNH-hydrolase domains [Dyadobacter koreensis]
MNKYLFSLDYLRGLAAVSVCFFHFTTNLHYLENDDPVKHFFSFGHFGVQVFFIISGLVIPYSMAKGNYTIRKFSTFFKKRLIRIEPPYLFCVFLALLLNYITTLTPFYIGKPFKIDYAQVFYHFGYLNIFMGKEWLNHVFWTLAIEFQYYLLIALIFPLVSHKKAYVWITALVLFNAASFFFNKNFVFHFSIFFTTGILLYRYFSEISGKSELSIALISVLAFLFLRYTYEEIIVVVFTIIVILIPLKPTLLSTFFGNISYSLYLFHTPVGARLLHITRRFSDSESLRHGMILVAFIFSVLVSYFLYKMIEKPFKKLSQKIRYDAAEPSVITALAPQSIS